MFDHLAVTLQSTIVKHKIKQIKHPQKILLKSRDSISSSKFFGSFVFKRGKRSWGNHQNWTLCCSAASNHCRSEEISGCIERTREFAKSAKHFARNCFGDCVVLLHNEKIKRDRQRHLATFCLFFYHLLFLLSSAFSILIY